MSYSAHFYNAAGEFCFFELGFTSIEYAAQAACDGLAGAGRQGYRAEVRHRTGFIEPSTIVATVSSEGIISYVKS